MHIFLTTKPHFFDAKGLEILDRVLQFDNVGSRVHFYFDTSFESDESLMHHIKGHAGARITFIKDYTDAKLDFGLVFGGDGSVMWANKYLREYPHDLPLITFNLGSVGFISKFRVDEIDDVLKSIHALSNGEQPVKQLYVECYPKLQSVLHDKDGNEIKRFTSINEIVIEKPGAYSNWMEVSIDGIDLLALNADGLLFATQMGSTAYNASVNGPFLFPGSNNFIMSAIAPFAINFKSVVLDASSQICVNISEGNYGPEVKINSDSNDSQIMTKGQKLCVQASERKLCIMHWEDDLKKQWVSKIAKLYRWQ